MCKVLIVEDEILIANLIEDYITSDGYTTENAIDYNEAIDAINTQTIDIILLDVSLSGEKNGIDVANYINDNKIDIPFIYLTSHSDPATLRSLAETSPASYLSKPFKQIDIVAALNIQALKVKNKISSAFKLEIGKKTYEIDLTNLLYVKSDHIYCHIYFTDNKELMLRSTIKNIENLLPKNAVIRINKSVLVNPKFVTKSNKSRVIINDEIELKYSRKFRVGKI